MKNNEIVKELEKELEEAIETIKTAITAKSIENATMFTMGMIRALRISKTMSDSECNYYANVAIATKEFAIEKMPEF